MFAYGKTYEHEKGDRADEAFENTYNNVTVIESLPDYYKTYYKHLEAAMHGGKNDKGNWKKVTNLESTSASEISSWHSNVVLRAVINTMFTRDSKGNVKEVTAKIMCDWWRLEFVV